MFAAPTGGGKSYFVGKCVEDLYAEKIPFILFDTKTENHNGLIELPEVKRLPIHPRVDYDKIIPYLLDYPYILCIPASKSIPINEIVEIYTKIMSYFWLHEKGGRVLIAEEAHNWNKNSAVPNPLFEQIAREGRSSKMFIWFITQRLQNFPLLLWSQCAYTYLWHFNIPPDIRYAGHMVPDFETINREELQTHDVLVWDNHEYEIIKADQIKRRTTHRG